MQSSGITQQTSDCFVMKLPGFIPYIQMCGEKVLAWTWQIVDFMLAVCWDRYVLAGTEIGCT